MALVVLLVAATAVVGSGDAVADGQAGAFEIDGNRVDSPAGGPIDWSTPPPNNIPFEDLSGSNDDSFNTGSKNQEPGGWDCQTGSAPAKDDILSGDIAFREVLGQQFAYVDFFRLSATGSANVDYEFNQSALPNPACPDLPRRTHGDISIAFDAAKGGKDITVRAFVWQGNDVSGTFVEAKNLDPANTLVEHQHWDGAVNDATEIPGKAAGVYGEASINLTRAFGTIECGDFSSVYMKSRAAKEINSTLKDRTTKKPAAIGQCPESQLDKGVRNASVPSSVFADSASASPGDTIEYQLVYTNAGSAAATNVVITDPIPANSTFSSCSHTCAQTTNTSGVVTSVSWSAGTVAPGGTVTRTFQVVLDPTFAATTTDISNTASVDTDEEEPTPSDEVEVTVTAPADSELHKGVRNITSGLPGPTANDFAGSVDAAPGDAIEYQFAYHNHGTGPATNVTVSDEVPDHSTWTACTPACSLTGTTSGSTMTWNIGAVAAGGSAVVKFRTVLASTFAQNGTTVTNVGTTDSATEDPEDSNPADVRVASGPTSGLAKGVRNVTTGLPAPAGSFSSTSVDAGPGNDIEYRLTYTNTGSGPATNVRLFDEVPGFSTFKQCSDSCTRTPSGGTAPGTEVSWIIASVPAGGTATRTFQTTLASTFSQNSTTIPNTASVTDQLGTTDSNTTSVVVAAPPAPGLTKAAENLDTPTGNSKPGDRIKYTFTYTNSGAGPATNVAISDEVPDLTTFAACSDLCTRTPPGASSPGTVVSWAVGTVAAGDSVSRHFTVTLDASFPSGNTAVCNVGTATDHTGPTDSNQVCITVTASPALTLDKTADGTEFNGGDVITFTIAYANSGNGAATNVKIIDPVPSNTSFVACSDGCTRSPADATAAGTIVTWDIGAVPGGAGGSVTLTVRLATNAGCQVCNVAGLTSDQNSSAVLAQRCVIANPQDQPELAHARGSAFGARVEYPFLSIDQTFVPVASDADSATATPDSENDTLAKTPTGVASVLKAEVLGAFSESRVLTGTSEPARAFSTDFAEAANVDIAGGLVTAKAVRAYAEANASGTNATVSSAGSSIKDLVVNGHAVNTVTPNMRIDLPADVFGPGSYVAIYEEEKDARLGNLPTTGATSTGGNSSSSGGDTYIADITVNMIRVHITDQFAADDGLAVDPTPDDEPLDVTVASATAHADFPLKAPCILQAGQSVSGHAYMLSATTAPSLMPVMQGYVEIPAIGGHAHQGYDEGAVPGATTGLWATDSFGVIDKQPDENNETSSTASSYAQAANVCLLPSAGSCTISAEAVRSQSNSSASGANSSASETAASDAEGSFLADLAVVGVPVVGGVEERETSPPDNKVIDLGYAFVVLNEQFPDAVAPGHTGLTVRAIRVTITLADNPFDLPVGARIVVAEAHSDATWDWTGPEPPG